MKKFPAKAFALPLVIWGVLVISAAVVSTVLIVGGRMSDASLTARGSRARELALTGIAYGSHPAIYRYDPLLTQEVGPMEKYAVTIQSEGGRCNINAALKHSDLQPLKDLFLSWGIDSGITEKTVNALADWVDADDAVRSGGAESADYVEDGKTGLPLNAEFQSLDEMAAVRGMDEVAAVKPDWRDYFTVWGPDKVDINEAGAELIAALGGISIDTAFTLIDTRNGSDALVGTEDDQRFTSISQAAEVMGLTEEQSNRLSQWFGTESDVVRIESRAEVAGFVKTITVIAQKQKDGKSASTIMAWQER